MLLKQCSIPAIKLISMLYRNFSTDAWHSSRNERAITR